MEIRVFTLWLLFRTRQKREPILSMLSLSTLEKLIPGVLIKFYIGLMGINKVDQLAMYTCEIEKTAKRAKYQFLGQMRFRFG